MKRQRTLEISLVVVTAALLVGWVFQYQKRMDLVRRLEYTRLQQEADRRRAVAAEARTQLLVSRLGEQLRGFRSDLGQFTPPMLKKYQGSFVEVYAYYRDGRDVKASYGTACYLGDGYFITSKHIVAPYAGPGQPRPPAIQAIKIKHKGKLIDVALVDAGDATVKGEVNLGDWAVLHTEERPIGLQALRVNTAYDFPFADPLVRFGNDYNHGVFVSLGYAGQTDEAGWVTWLVDLHPGASGGGVLNLKEELVGLNAGALEGDNRIAVIIPIRAEMLRKVPGVALAAAGR